MATKVVQKVWKAVRKVVKAPWEVTGPTASPEYMSDLPSALEYRKFSPATPTEKPYIPQAEPEHVYDIKYYTRDTRRARPEKMEIDFNPHNPDDLKFLDKMPPSPRIWVMGKRRDIYDESERPDGGYQHWQ